MNEREGEEGRKGESESTTKRHMLSIRLLYKIADSGGAVGEQSELSPSPLSLLVCVLVHDDILCI